MRLTLRELESLAGALLPVLLALMLARIAREHTQLFQFPAQLRVELDQCASDAQLGGSGLPIGAAAGCGDPDIELLGRFGGQQRLPHNRAGCLAREVMFKGAAVYRDLALPVPQEDSRDRSLAAPCSNMLYESQFGQISLRRSQCHWFLRLVRMLRTGVDLQLAVHLFPEFALREHALDCFFHHPRGTGRPYLPRLSFG